MKMQEALEYLTTIVGDPRRGLPEEVFRFASSIVPMINVDLLIKNSEGKTLLTWRSDGYFPAGWHIPGGIIRYKETTQERISAVAASELGAAVSSSEKPLAINEIIMKPSWRVRGHFISLLYECKLSEEPTLPQASNHETPGVGEWAWHDGCPDNLYKAQDFYRQYINRDRKGM